MRESTSCGSMDSDSDGESLFLTQSKTSSKNEEFDFPDPCLTDEALSQTVCEMEEGITVGEHIHVKPEKNEGGDGECPVVLNPINTKPVRFKSPKTDVEMIPYFSRRLASSTEKKCSWAAGIFRRWQSNRNAFAKLDDDISTIVPDLLQMTKDELCYSVSRFLCEICKDDGDEYPAPTLYELVISIQLYLELNGKVYKLLQDDAFLQLKNTLDHLMKQRSREGLTARSRQAEVLSLTEQELLWRCVLGTDTPRKLVDTILYLLGLNFALRAGAEHRNLRWINSQLCIMTDSNGLRYLRYCEDTSKANQGGLKHRKVKRKIVYAYEDRTNRDRCIVSAFEAYDRHCPKERPAFYLRPLDKPKGEVWFSSQPIGISMLAKTVGRLCKASGIPGFRTNHSLRATAATRLYEADVDEQLICEITGHKSTAVREYKRTSDHQRFASSSVISGRQDECPVPAKTVCVADKLSSNNCKCARRQIDTCTIVAGMHILLQAQSTRTGAAKIY